MNTYDNWLTRGAEGPDERDEEAFDRTVEWVAEGESIGDREYAIITIYEAMPALNHALREVIFPEHLRPYIVAIAKLAADIRAKVDDEYKARTTTYDDPRD